MTSAKSKVKIIFINGAPRSGKDTLAAHLIDIDYDGTGTCTMDEVAFKQPLIDAVAGLFGIGYSTWWERYESDDKDKPWDLLKGMTQREALIWISEDVGKVKFGRDFFGKAMVNIIETSEFELVVIPDSGFLEETQTVVDHFGAENCVMINTYRDGTNFDNDSRSLITGKMLGIDEYPIKNNGTTADLKIQAEAVYEAIMQ